MANVPEDMIEGDGEIRLSRQLAALHLAGVVFLVVVVVASVLWVSAEHNRLAKDASQRLVSGGIAAHRNKVTTLVRDYSIWDEAYEAVRADDISWLYRNIGNAAAEIGTLDLILFYDPVDGSEIAWREGSPPTGELGLMPERLRADLLTALDQAGRSRAVFARIDDELWAFSPALVTPVAGRPANVPVADLPRQIHGLRLSQERLDVLAESLLIAGGLAIAEQPSPGQASTPLNDGAGEIIAHVVWSPPRPGASILSRIAMPLSLALAFASGIALVSAGYAVRSARRLERALRDARAADRLKSEFLSNVTHELRTPMNGIIGAAQLLGMSRLDDEQRELVGVLDDSARTQMSLITDLLDFTRLESGHSTLVPAPFAPVLVLEEVTRMIRAGLAGRDIELTADWRGLGGLVVEGDARAFRQIVTNLLGNAVKFTRRGRISVRATAVCSGRDVTLTVEVSDTGVGIPPDELTRIFERFHRVDSSLTRTTDGAGLGLSISQRLAALMGGVIDVESKLGEGSTFRLRLGLALAESGGAAQPQSAA